MTTQKALYAFRRTGAPFSGPTGVKAAGNGCLMRLAPVPLLYWKQPAIAMGLAGDSARITHGAAIAIDACKYVPPCSLIVQFVNLLYLYYRYYAGLIIGCLHNITKELLLSPKYSPAGIDYWSDRAMVG